MRIAFLHIPKTAGQSIHHSLINLFPKDSICPARTNSALHKYAVSDLSRYRLFSGHLDWSIVKQSGPFDFVFTVLRDPLDRIFSFYFYLRKEAEIFQAEGKPLGAGMQAALQYTPEQYFSGGQAGMRRFLDNHYNNFYAYYFASGCYSGHSLLAKKFPPGSSELLHYAQCGLRELDGVYTLSNLHRLEADISSLTHKEIPQIHKANENKQVQPAARQKLLTDLSGSWDWRPTLNKMIATDEVLYKDFES